MTIMLLLLGFSGLIVSFTFHSIVGFIVSFVIYNLAFWYATVENYHKINSNSEDVEELFKSVRDVSRNSVNKELVNTLIDCYNTLDIGEKYLGQIRPLENTKERIKRTLKTYGQSKQI